MNLSQTWIEFFNNIAEFLKVNVPASLNLSFKRKL